MNTRSKQDRTPTEVIVVIGAGSIGQAIARRVSAGSDFLMDGGVTAAYRFGELAPS